MSGVGIIGAGIVGVALGRALAQRGLDVTILEKERRVAHHQTGNNSGVVHAGIYYAPGSLKAALCARGRAATREYCLENNLPYREVGKLVVAVTDDDLPALAELERRSTENRVPDLRRLTVDDIATIEPHVRGVAGLHSPHTAVVDYAAITECMTQEVRRAGGHVFLGQRVQGVTIGDKVVHVSTPAQTFQFDHVIACAGLQSDLVARLVGSTASPKILPFRGEYWAMRPARSHLVRGMIYPVPDPRYPFLGVHFTRGVYQDVHVGPSAVPALAREGYRWTDISAKDTWSSLRWPGASALARQHWRMGVKEVAASLLKPLYFREARRFMPDLQMSDLDHRSTSGVRAQAWGADGSLLDDFAVDRVGPVTLLRNAPSPAATSALAIADYLVDEYRVVG